MNIKNLLKITLISATTISIVSCGGNKGNEEKGEKLNNWDNPNVINHELSDPQMLNPVNSTDASATYIQSNIFQTLLGIDFKTLELVPVLATSRPEIIENNEGGLNFVYEIRPEAKWDDGTPITAKDVEFTLKVIKAPGVDNYSAKPYYEFIQDIIIDEQNPKKFTLVTNSVYVLGEVMSGDYTVLPKKVYDPEGILDNYTLKQISENFESLKEDENLKKFADNFNSEKYQREPQYIIGSGPYKLKEWQTGQKIVLERKKDWWGDALVNENVYFEAFPPELIYQTINDQSTALVALKGGNVDVMRGIKPKDFKDLPNSPKFQANFNAHTPSQMAYAYIGLNMRNPKFADINTRKAFAHLVDLDKIINNVVYGYATPAIGPEHPSKKKFYNDKIKPYEFNPAKAKELLEKAGWKDSNGNGTIDKVIDGQLTEFEVTYIYNNGNDTRKNIGLLLQEEARKVGVKVNVNSLDWSIFLEKTKNHDFDLYAGGWVSSPIPSDPKQIWHTSSYNGGSNYVGFGNDETDALIDSIRVTIDDDKRAVMLKRFQEILHEQVPYIFLYYPQERIAIHKRFTNAETSPMRPGYHVASFKLKEEQAQ
jgi:peptide/nickel transport system substrate-binding protein